MTSLVLDVGSTCSMWSVGPPEAFGKELGDWIEDINTYHISLIYGSRLYHLHVYITYTDTIIFHTHISIHIIHIYMVEYPLQPLLNL